MGDNLANTVPLINDTRSRESDPSDRLITTFLIAHSRIFRELAELREEVSKLTTRDPSHTTLVLHERRY